MFLHSTLSRCICIWVNQVAGEYSVISIRFGLKNNRTEMVISIFPEFFLLIIYWVNMSRRQNTNE